MDEEGVTISFKEIYDQQMELSKQMSNMNLRMDRIEKRLDDKENWKMSFSEKVKITLISTLIPVGLGVIYFVAAKGGL